MKIVLWIGNGTNQRALVNKIHKEVPVIAIVTESKKHKRKFTIKKVFEKIVEKSLLSSVARAWFGMLEYYGKRYSSYPDVPVLDVENINCDEVFHFTDSFKPDLILVSGTRLIRKKLLSIKTGVGIINLHTGLSPYIKGGPNCTNWCIAEKKFHLIGNTIMWIDEGIDSGNIMATEFTEFNGKESLLEIHIKVMDHAHDLSLRSIKQVAAGKIINIPQNQIAAGTTYYTKQWGLKEKINLIHNLSSFRAAMASGTIKKDQATITTIPIDADF